MSGIKMRNVDFQRTNSDYLAMKDQVESLRKQVDAEKLANTILIKDCDKYKHRLGLVTTWMQGKYRTLSQVDLWAWFVQDHPVAKDWQEEE